MNQIIRIIALWIGLTIHYAATAETTPSCFEPGQKLDSQLQPCTEQTGHPCHEPIEQKGRLAAYVVKHTQNIPGGTERRRSLMADNGVIQLVFLQFPSNVYSQIDSLLKTLFGSPNFSEITQSKTALASLQNTWVVDGGLISHHQQVGDGSTTMVSITCLD